MDNLAVDNQDVENGVNEFADLISKLWDGLVTFLDLLPPVVIGGIVFILLVIWAIHAIKD